MTDLHPPASALSFLERLIDVRGPSGFEAPVQSVWLDYVRPHADYTESDAYGNTWAVLEPGSTSNDPPTVVVTGHADEIGLMINHIESSGLLRVVPVGGVDPAMLPGRRIRINTPRGEIRGVIGAVPIHLQDKSGDRKAPTIDQLFVDCGFADEDEARESVRVGLIATIDQGLERLGQHRVVARATDNRIGIFTAAEVLRRLSERRDQLRYRLIALSTVQEEIGLVGAQFVTRRLNPDVALVVDVTHATDVPGVSQAKHGKVEMGAGPTITHGTANHPLLVQHLVDTAAATDIAIQHEASSRYTGTDTDAIYRATTGIPSALLSLPNRYMHTPSEVIDLRDLERLVRLTTEAVLRLDPARPFRVVDDTANP
ncbi:MAG: M42 family peptidase [Candidatus Dadabacteria bacterium]|nr:MAG: M42 family peptidase [Candidatus Dadabacteria bacterium]